MKKPQKNCVMMRKRSQRSNGREISTKRQYIIKKAREVFSKRGYKDVTMKDIVEACEISRGGLYLYFDSTKVIFLAVLNDSEDDEEDVFQKQFLIEPAVRIYWHYF